MEGGNGIKPNNDLKKAYRTAYLIAGYIKHTLTEEEQDELDDWVVASEANMQLFGELTDEKNIAQSLEWYKKLDVEKALAESKGKISFKKPKVLKRFIQLAVAACIIIAVGLILFLKPSSKKPTPEITKTMPADILPGSDKATLTLENGTVFFLAPDKKDTIIDSRITIAQQKGEIVYSNQSTAGALTYHLLSIPRKGQYKLVLPDGTKVWLNAESTIRYPIAFSEKERRVYVTGETYFEVAKDKSKPFRVVVNDDITVEALGTQFNINAYNDEDLVSTTLVEGSVLISKGSIENILKPGQQAQISVDHFNIIEASVNDVTAWKRYEFKFTKAPIDEIMRQIARWYDAEIIYQEKPKYHFNATIGRNVPVSKLLHWLEETDQVHFKIVDNKITVMK